MGDILIIAALILLNGVFSMSELALVSAKRLRLEKLSAEGSRGAKVALALADDPSHFLSTIQVGITLISIFNGAFGEASLVSRLTPQLEGVPGIGPYAREVALAIVVFAITVASIIFGELVPKRIAMEHPERMATLVARPLDRLSRVMSPFVHLLAAATNGIARLLGMGRKPDETPT
ncbi:MAG TPA: CNNM domain-containing protein, partial [Telluria sp.]|nr:CNNM domain-containing protein [Telluria sp.]